MAYVQGQLVDIHGHYSKSYIMQLRFLIQSAMGGKMEETQELALVHGQKKITLWNCTVFNFQQSFKKNWKCFHNL